LHSLYQFEKRPYYQDIGKKKFSPEERKEKPLARLTGESFFLFFLSFYHSPNYQPGKSQDIIWNDRD